MKTTDKKTACSTCDFLNAAIEIIQNRNQLEWGYVPQLGVMGYYWRKAYVGGDKIEDVISYIASSVKGRGFADWRRQYKGQS